MKFSATVWLAAIFLTGLTTLSPGPSLAQEIYTCVDGQGRKITADRPIPECRDREQNLLNPSGAVKGKVGPALSEQERQEQAAAANKQALQLAHQLEEQRRERALLMRYPSQARHDEERAQSLAQIGAVIKAANRRIVELTQQRVELDAEMEFYKKQPPLAPPVLHRQLEENTRSLAVQKRFIADQQADMKRTNSRFEEELARLQLLWAAQSNPPDGVKGKTR